jgi:hypothetical protein
MAETRWYRLGAREVKVLREAAKRMREGDVDMKQHRLKLQEDLRKVRDHLAKVQAEDLTARRDVPEVL